MRVALVLGRLLAITNGMAGRQRKSKMKDENLAAKSRWGMQLWLTIRSTLLAVMQWVGRLPVSWQKRRRPLQGPSRQVAGSTVFQGPMRPQPDRAAVPIGRAQRRPTGFWGHQDAWYRPAQGCQAQRGGPGSFRKGPGPDSKRSLSRPVPPLPESRRAGTRRRPLLCHRRRH